MNERVRAQKREILTLKSSPTGLSGTLRTPRELALFMLLPREPHASTLSVRSKGRGEGVCVWSVWMAVRHGCAFVNRINASHTQVRVTLQNDVIGLLK